MTGFYCREAVYRYNMDENERLAFKMLTIFANNCGYEKIDLFKWEDEVGCYFTLSLVILQNILHQIEIISYIQLKAIMMSFYKC